MKTILVLNTYNFISIKSHTFEIQARLILCIVQMKRLYDIEIANLHI